ncbi:MAG: acetate/propionate family kinase [Hyphomonadaceae bacterium]|nr:acetate/propionate family kinase [Hyphomonadaceae bacterium]
MGPILTINCGSSSVRVACFEADVVWRAHFSGIGREDPQLTIGRAGKMKTIEPSRAGDHGEALEALFSALPPIAPNAIGHRVVHGGVDFVAPTLLGARVEARLLDFAAMAPLHQGANLAGVAAARARWPARPHVACFDTAFHANLPKAAAMMALPRDFFNAGVRRFGFHGLSIVSILAALQSEGVDTSRERIVVAHLGAGASMTAIEGGRSIETSMGFSTVSGLPMATRSGDIDPGVVLHLLRAGRSLEDVEDLLNRRSGLLGLSGVSADMAELLVSPDPRAAEAVELFCRTARRWLAGLAGVLGGVDRVVFTGGIGENAPRVRAAICEGLIFMGVDLDQARNEAGAGVLSRDGAQVIIEARAADEEAVIAHETRAALATMS